MCRSVDWRAARGAGSDAGAFITITRAAFFFPRGGGRRLEYWAFWLRKEDDMGTWAEGNFDNDYALDFVGDIANEVAGEMSAPEMVEDVDLVMAAVAVRKALVEHCHAPAPKHAEIEKLKLAVLAVYDKEIDGLDPGEEYKEKRRAVIEKTFDDFLMLLER
jgi:hypothetical protein